MSPTVVKKRCTSTWSLSATSIQANPPPPVQLRAILTPLHILIHLRTFDLQVRWYRQAYYREIREGTSIILVLSDAFQFRVFCGGASLPRRDRRKFSYRTHNKASTTTNADSAHRKPPSWARAPSSMHGFSTS